MPNILVRDLPEVVHDQLVKRAAAAGQSLQQYLTTELTRVATTPTMAEVLARIAGREGGRVGLAQAVEDVIVERDGR